MLNLQYEDLTIEMGQN